MNAKVKAIPPQDARSVVRLPRFGSVAECTTLLKGTRDDPTVDVCDLARVPTWRGVNRSKNGDRVNEESGYCTPESPCGLGEGDCDTSDDSTCRGYLRCTSNVGHLFGFENDNVDVCVHPDYY